MKTKTTTKPDQQYSGAGETFLMNYNGDSIANMRRDIGATGEAAPYEVQFKY